MRPVSERFWAKVEKLGANECWVWKGATRRGYGVIRLGGVGSQIIGAHRVAYELMVGPIPETICVLHYCDNRSCVNPGHLWLGTKLDNASDREAKGRGITPSGEEHGAKLTWPQINEIRRRYRTGQFSYRELAAEYGVSASNICLIVNQRHWKPH